MKNFILLLILVTFTHQIVFSQDEEIPKQYNYFQIVKDLETEFKKVKADSTNDNQLVKLDRFKSFWRDRVPSNGDMRSYGKAMMENFSRTAGTTGSSCKTDCSDCCVQSNWNYLGPRFIDNQIQNLGKITAIWVDPSDAGHILAGSEAGLWKTIDGGDNWQNNTDYCLPGIGIFSIAVHPTNQDIIYVGTGYDVGASHTGHKYGYGVYKTTDGGVSWNQMPISFGNLENGIANKIIIHPTLYSNIYAAIGSKIYKTTNSGANWIEVFGNSENPHELRLYDLEIVVNGTVDRLYTSSYTKRATFGCIPTPAAGTYNWGDISGYCQTNYTASFWQFDSNQNTTSSFGAVFLNPLLPSYNRVSIMGAISITNNSVNFASQTNYDASPGSPPTEIKIYRKPLGGTAWSLLATSPANGLNYGFSFPFDVSPANENIMYYGGHELNKSTNAGASFNNVNNYWDFWYNPTVFAGSHPDIRSNGYLFNTASINGLSDMLTWGNDGGIGRTTDGGATSLNLNGKGLQLTQFHGISNSEVLPGLIYGGTQDNGTYNNTGQNWKNYPFGDGYDVVSDEINPMIAYMTMNSCGLRKTINGGNTWGYFAPPIGECIGNASLYMEKNGSTLYMGKKNLWKYSGGIWSPISSFTGTNSDIVDIDMSDNGVIKYIAYAGPVWGSANREKKVYKFDNLGCVGGCDISTNLPGIDWAGITDLATDSTGDHLWVSFGGLWNVNNKVFHYYNGTWTPFGQGLPNIPSNSIEYFEDGLLFLGTDDGVFYRDQTMMQWERFSCNLPNTIIVDLEINKTSNTLRAGTYSRGIWDSSINYKLGNNQYCNPAMVARARISPSTPFSSPLVFLQDNHSIQVRSKHATVSIDLRNICTGTSCCSADNNIEWKVYKDNVLYSQGTTQPITFGGIFRSGFWLFKKRHTYKVEVNLSCGKEDCGTKTYYFRG